MRASATTTAAIRCPCRANRFRTDTTPDWSYGEGPTLSVEEFLADAAK